ncbi:putative Zinc finger, SWIM-type, MULE transposase domain-containing protein [Plasmopara halstedii]
MMASRIKRQLQDSRLTQVRTSFQKLRGYLSTVAEKNPGSLFRVDTRDDGAFTRALFIPNATLNSVKSCRKILSLDHIIPRIETPSESIIGNLEDGDIDDVICGVYLKAATKDFNDDVITFALALVTEENQTNWEWFLTALQNTQVVDWNQYTIFAGRMYGLEAAIHSVWPLASHHYCMRRLIEDELETTTKLHLSIEKKQSLFDLARSDSEVEFDTLYKALVTTNEAVMAYLNNLDRANWVKYAFLENFRRPTFNELTSDLSMALGSDELLPQHASRSHIDWFGQDTISSSYPLNAFHQYFIKIAEIFHQRRQSVKTRPGHELVPKRDAQLQQILQGSQRCESIPCSNGLFMVRYLGPTRLQIPDSWRHVNLVDWECTCLDWQDQHFPCLHAIHASELEQRRINSLYDAKQNSIGKYLASYSTSFAPWPIEASPIDPSLKTPLDFYFSEDGTGRRKPGPRPKRKRLNEDLNREEKL